MWSLDKVSPSSVTPLKAKENYGSDLAGVVGSFPRLRVCDRAESQQVPIFDLRFIF